MSFKTIVAAIFIAIMLLTNVTLTISMGKARSGEGTENGEEQRSILSPSQSGSESCASISNGLQGASESSVADSRRSEKAIYNTFNFDSFAKDLSNQKTEEWSNFAYIDSDSAELVIGLDPTQSDYTSVFELIYESGGELVNTVSMGAGLVAVVADVPLNLVVSFEAQLRSSTLVRYVEPNMKFEAQFAPDDSYWYLQWGPQKIEADYAWDTTIGDSSVLVAVIDTGIDYNHPDLDANYVALGYDWVSNDPDPMDDHGHGTHCAGIIAAELSNAEGIAGVAQVSIMAEKGLSFDGSGSEDQLANALIHSVDQGADILSNSWGGYGHSELIYDAVRYAYDAGVLIVAAAGNDATNRKLYPAGYDEVIAVAATDQKDDPASFTNFGDWVEVAAPGVDIYSTVWNDGYTYMSGTSMATPHVSGTAALVWSQFPNMSRDWILAQLTSTADDLGAPGFDNYYGYGRINARKAVEQEPSDHDLLIFDWMSPRSIQPGDLVISNITVFNFGLNDEGNITVELLVSSTVVDSAVIGFLASGTSAIVSTLWHPAVEGTYNVTCYVLPVPGETTTENNAANRMILVRYLPNLLVVDTPVPEDTDALDKLGYEYTLITPAEFVTVNLYEFNGLFIGWMPGDELVNALLSRASDIASWVADGNGIVALAESGEANRWAWLPVWVSGSYGGGDSVHILDSVHPVMSNLTDPELSNWGSSYHGCFSSYDSAWDALAEDSNIYQPITLVTTYGAGRIAITYQDPDFHFSYGNRIGAEKLLRNMIDWAAVYTQYEHELVVSLEAPTFVKPGDSSLLKATVKNQGLSNETDVELFLLINGALVDSATVPELVNGTFYRIDHDWTPKVEATYNITAYSPSVVGENVTLNNIATKFVTVASPLISPIEGQWASYALNYYSDTGGLIATEYWHLIYDHYVDPFRIYITVVSTDRYGYNYTQWMIVNTMTRLVESGMWVGMWYPGWIETDIDVGSTVNLLNSWTVVNGSKIVPVGMYPIDCWELPLWYVYQYTFWFDKVSGLWIGMDYFQYPYRIEVRLADTNIPIGTSYEHELAAIVETPTRLEPGDSSLLNATAYNVGLNTETDVKLSLFIDGVEVANEIIPAFLNGTSRTITYTWTPTVEATYNVTAYVQPVVSEALATNNVATKLVRVRSVKGYVLFDQTHWTDSMYSYSIWVNNITDRGYIVDALTTSPLTSAALQGYDVFVIPQAHNYYSSDEILAVRNFVLEGGGLLVIGDDSTYIYSELTRFAGITWESGGYGGSTNDITPHQVTEGVTTAYFAGPMSKISASVPAQSLIRDLYGNIMLAVSETEAGAVIGVSDEDSINDYSIGIADNLRLANNMIDWLSGRSPIVSFTYSPPDPYVGETLSFVGSASYDPDGVIVDYLWNFGDGEVGAGVAVTHVYVAGGTYKVSLTGIDNEGFYSTATANLTVARTTLEASVEVGSIHFRGELAEFYILVSSLGNPVDADLTATLCSGGAVYADLSASVERVTIGLYRIPYTIPVAASPGTYALMVGASYFSLKGVALESFLLSSTLTGWNTLLIKVNGTVGTLKTDTGLIRVQLDAINAKLVRLNGTVATIQSDIGNIRTDIANIGLRITCVNGTTATIETTLGTVKGQIVSIHDDELATIVTDLGTVTASLPPGWTESQPQNTTSLYILLILILIISIGTITLMFFRRKKS